VVWRAGLKVRPDQPAPPCEVEPAARGAGQINRPRVACQPSAPRSSRPPLRAILLPHLYTHSPPSYISAPPWVEAERADLGPTSQFSGDSRQRRPSGRLHLERGANAFRACGLPAPCTVHTTASRRPRLCDGAGRSRRSSLATHTFVDSHSFTIGGVKPSNCNHAPGERTIHLFVCGLFPRDARSRGDHFKGVPNLFRSGGGSIRGRSSLIRTLDAIAIEPAAWINCA